MLIGLRTVGACFRYSNISCSPCVVQLITAKVDTSDVTAIMLHGTDKFSIIIILRQRKVV